MADAGRDERLDDETGAGARGAGRHRRRPMRKVQSRAFISSPSFYMPGVGPGRTAGGLRLRYNTGPRGDLSAVGGFTRTGICPRIPPPEERPCLRPLTERDVIAMMAPGRRRLSTSRRFAGAWNRATFS
jgi:hypothetical protein